LSTLRGSKGTGDAGMKSNGNSRAERRRLQRESMKVSTGDRVGVQTTMLVTRQSVESFLKEEFPEMKMPDGPGWMLLSHSAVVVGEEVIHMHSWNRQVRIPGSGLVRPGQ